MQANKLEGVFIQAVHYTVQRGRKHTYKQQQLAAVVKTTDKGRFLLGRR
jgi:hypothetical protein